MGEKSNLAWLFQRSATTPALQRGGSLLVGSWLVVSLPTYLSSSSNLPLPFQQLLFAITERGRPRVVVVEQPAGCVSSEGALGHLSRLRHLARTFGKTLPVVDADPHGFAYEPPFALTGLAALRRRAASELWVNDSRGMLVVGVDPLDPNGTSLRYKRGAAIAVAAIDALRWDRLRSCSSTLLNARKAFRQLSLHESVMA